MSGAIIPGLIGHTRAALSGPPSAALLSGVFNGNDPEDGGKYYVSGTLMIDSAPDIPVRRKVWLICAISGRLVRDVWSDEATGAYLFANVRRGPWVVVGRDYLNNYNAVIADNKLGDLM